MSSDRAPLRVWPSSPPADCPLVASSTLRTVAFTGRHASYTDADTWYPSWAEDGQLYSPFTDGTVGTWAVGSFDPLATTGHAKIVGDDPLALSVEPIGSVFGPAKPYGGRYPCGSLVKDGVWYYGTYCLDETGRGLNWDVLGPFVGFRLSHDLGRTWTDTTHTPAAPIFGESGKANGKVRIGAPHFVDFGQNMQHSPDGKAYLVAHGGSDSRSPLTWISGDDVYLLRVDPSPETINDPAAYEFWDGGRWRPDLADIRPLVSWPGHAGCVTASYHPGLDRYLMCVTDGWPTTKSMSTYLLEAESLTGPWRLVNYLKDFGSQGYFVNIPTKFIADDNETMWLCYSANFTRNYLGEQQEVYEDPPGSRYAMCLQEFRLS